MVIDPNEQKSYSDQEIFESIDWSTESNYTGYDDDDELDDEWDALLTDVNMGTDYD